MEVHMEEKHTIVLSNGKSYEATLNGNNYIFDTVVPSDVFTNDTIKNMKIDALPQISIRWLLILWKMARTT